jgi:hypothetical protein
MSLALLVGFELSLFAGYVSTFDAFLM